MKFKVSYYEILPKSVTLDEVGYVRDDVVTQLRAELAEERELADRMMRALAEARNWNWIDLEDDRDDGVDVDCIMPDLVKLDREIGEILAAHTTRRRK